MDNDPPVIIAFGPPDPKEVIHNGNGHVANGNGVAKQNGAVKSMVAKMNGNHGPATVVPDGPYRFSPDSFRKELLKELDADRKRPTYLR